MKNLINKFGLPRVIIVLFFLVLVISSKPLGLNTAALIGDAIRRWAMYGVLVLAMVPAVQCGIGLNFGITLGIVGGLLGALVVVEVDMTNMAALVAIGPNFAKLIAIVVAMILGAAIASVIGILYGMLLNKVKGSEMTVSTYVGFSIIALMNIGWLSLPFTSGEIIWPLGGSQGGLRNTINLGNSFGSVFNDFLGFYIGGENGVYIPTGLILVFFFACFCIWLFMRSKTGIAMSAVGSNPVFAKAAGLNVNKMRILGTAISTALAAVGIIIYAQSYGFLQLYNAPMMMGFHCVAAVLIGGASTGRAKISHVILGTFLFQGMLAVALPVTNKILPEGNISDVVRVIISYGIILYALSKSGGGKVRE